jgi:hypothetical protein
MPTGEHGDALDSGAVSCSRGAELETVVRTPTILCQVCLVLLLPGKRPKRGLKSIGSDYLTRSLRVIVRYSMQRNQEFPIASLSNLYVNE